MSGAREEILGRIRAALRDVPDDERPDDVAVARGYRTHARGDLDRFVARAREYHAEVERVETDHLGAVISGYCADAGLRRMVVPAPLPAGWRPGGVDVVEDQGLSAPALDALDGAITGCAAAIAETGTVILDGQGVCGRRMITLVPDHHICVVRAEQVVGLVPEAIAALPDPRAPVTLISGPSASSDIELERVEGVHGPRHLLVLVATE